MQRRLLPAVTDVQQLLELFVNQETGERGLIITGAAAFWQPYRPATARIPGWCQRCWTGAGRAAGVDGGRPGAVGGAG